MLSRGSQRGRPIQSTHTNLGRKDARPRTGGAKTHLVLPRHCPIQSTRIWIAVNQRWRNRGVLSKFFHVCSSGHRPLTTFAGIVAVASDNHWAAGPRTIGNSAESKCARAAPEVWQRPLRGMAEGDQRAARLCAGAGLTAAFKASGRRRWPRVQGMTTCVVSEAAITDFSQRRSFFMACLSQLDALAHSALPRECPCNAAAFGGECGIFRKMRVTGRRG